MKQNQLLNPFQPSSTYVQSTNHIKDAIVNDKINYIYPTDSQTSGSQLYHSTYCVSDPSACCMSNPSCATYVIYKPNNPFFSTQGAVSSSTRILDIKYKAITKNNYDFTIDLSVNTQNTTVRLPGSTPINYRGDTDAPYFIKSKYQQIDACQTNCGSCYKISTHSKTRIDGRMPSGGTGIKTVCFPTHVAT